MSAAASPTILVTGATDGIGRQTALELLRRGATVLVHGRTQERAEATAEALRREAGSDRAEAFAADLASLRQVRQLAAAVAARHPRLDVLINNAGVFANERRLSEDGFELTMAVNHLAPFLLTSLLLPQLRGAAPARVVTVSSIAHTRGRLDFDAWRGARFDGYGAYAASKLANVLFAQELARREAPRGVASYSLHPGVITTKLLQTGFGSTGAGLDEGADTSVYLATAPAAELRGHDGAYFVRRKETPPSPAARDERLVAELWRRSAEAVGVPA